MIQASLAIIFPMFLLSGVLWPFIAMPVWLQWVAGCLPVTPACSALNHLVLRSSITPLAAAK